MTTLDHKNRAAETLSHSPRFTETGVDPNDLETLRIRIAEWDDWYREWCRMGEMHEKLGDDAMALSRTITAADAYFRASMYYHFAQFMWHHKPEEKEAASRKKAEVFLKGAPYHSPPSQPVDIPFENTAIPGYFRQASNEPGPCMIFLPGSDSCKEQFFTFESHFLRRGISTLTIDGPGQGVFRYVMPMRLDYEKAVIASVDWLLGTGKIDPERIALGGTSMGGYLAMRSAAFEPRLKAAVCMGGRYDLGEFAKRSPLGKDNITFLWGKRNWDEMAETAKKVSLQGLLDKVKCPVLIIHGAKDDTSPVSQAHRIAADIPHAKLVVFEEGGHVCHNIPYLYRPLVADWVKERLG